jgi:hypothetical protein
MLQLLNDMPLREQMHAAMAANRNYKTASIISARRGLGLHWVDRFDLSGAMAMNWHHLGESAHGSLVTVDPRVSVKFVRLDERQRMVALYGEKRTAQWERRYLGEQSVDGFLSRPPADLSQNFPSPFYAQGAWYLPELRDDYDTGNDNLIIIDATSERQLPRALNEMATFGCRYPRMVVFSQQPFLKGEGHKSFFKYPISNLILLPPMGATADMLPISECLLPLAMALVGTAMAVLGRGGNTTVGNPR